jgi:hypothetical protein
LRRWRVGWKSRQFEKRCPHRDNVRPAIEEAVPNGAAEISFSETLTYDIEVNLRRREFGPADVFADAAATAYIDPYFSVDQSLNSDPGAYSIVTSPGVGNAPGSISGIPEASTWAMLIVGFAGLGYAGLRRPKA